MVISGGYMLMGIYAYEDTCAMCLLQGLVSGLCAVVIYCFDGDA